MSTFKISNERIILVHKSFSNQTLIHSCSQKKAPFTNEECLKINVKSGLVLKNMHIVEGIHHTFY